jgi:ferrochelatase
MEHKVKDRVLLLVNTGTPDSPSVKHVRRYLSEFLSDRRVIDLPWITRKLLVNLIIVPFRAPRSAKLYSKLWTERGSPLIINLNNLALKVQKLVAEEYRVIGVCRYGNPSLKETLRKLKSHPPEEITVLPLFPQYASSTVGSINELIMNEIGSWEVIPEIHIAGQFYAHQAFIEAFADQIIKFEPDRFDHVLFSYHGLPVRHIQKIHPLTDCRVCNCNDKFPDYGEYCYKATCYETTRLLSGKLMLDPDNCSTSFQSRLSENWLTPFTDSKLKELARSGKKNVLVVAPSFVADCLETIVEIREEYCDYFKKNGGDKLVLSDSLNDNDKWAEAVLKISQ